MEYKEEYTDDDWEYLNSKREGHNPETVIDGIITWFTVFDKNLLDKIKDNNCYFDERFYPGGGEDYDLNCRSYSAGYRMLGIYNSWAYHHWSSTRIKKPPKLNPDLMWNNVDKKYNNGWNLFGVDFPIPACVKAKL